MKEQFIIISILISTSLQKNRKYDINKISPWERREVQIRKNTQDIVLSGG